MVAGLALAMGLAGCRLDMHDQPRFKPLRMSDFYADLRSSRPLEPGTIARGELRADSYLYTGMVNGNPGDEMPFPATREVLERGRERYNIYCAPCHSRTGDGNGMIVQRGYRRPPSYHIERLRNAPRLMTMTGFAVSMSATANFAAPRGKMSAAIILEPVTTMDSSPPLYP